MRDYVGQKLVENDFAKTFTETDVRGFRSEEWGLADEDVFFLSAGALQNKERAALYGGQQRNCVKLEFLQLTHSNIVSAKHNSAFFWKWKNGRTLMNERHR